MSASPIRHRWSLDEFVAACEAGRFDDQRVELIDGEVYPVVIGEWHGETTVRVIRTLPNGRFRITGATLPAGESLPDPDCWVLGRSAQPIAAIGRRLSRWAPVDVLLVVEVSDESLDMDLGRKALIYARSGYAHYWSVTPEGVYVHTEPTPNGYVQRVLHQRGEKVPVPCVDDVALDVTDLIGEPPTA